MAVFLHWKMLNFSPSPWNQGEEALIGRYTTDTIRNNISYCRRTNMCRHCKQLALTRPKRAISKMPICKLQPQQQERTKIAIIGHRLSVQKMFSWNRNKYHVCFPSRSQQHCLKMRQQFWSCNITPPGNTFITSNQKASKRMFRWLKLANQRCKLIASVLFILHELDFEVMYQTRVLQHTFKQRKSWKYDAQRSIFGKLWREMW